MAVAAACSCCSLHSVGLGKLSSSPPLCARRVRLGTLCHIHLHMHRGEGSHEPHDTHIPRASISHHILLSTLLSILPAAPAAAPQVDTLVMQNLGYFQLKASPGLWQLSIAPGRSRELYQVVSASSGSALATGWGVRRSSGSSGAQLEAASDASTQVLMDSFTGE